MIRRAKPIRRTPVKKTRGARRGPWRSERYRRWIAGHGCVVCGHPDVQAAHTVNGGMSMKGPDSTVAPLCTEGANGHHREFDSGRAKFDQKYGVDLYAISQQFWERWQLIEGKKVA